MLVLFTKYYKCKSTQKYLVTLCQLRRTFERGLDLMVGTLFCAMALSSLLYCNPFSKVPCTGLWEVLCLGLCSVLFTIENFRLLRVEE